MLPRRDQPFPIEAARDLLGVVRAFYRSTPRDEVVKRQRLQAAGEHLETAIELAASSRDGGVGHRAAWENAERADALLRNICELFDRARPVVEAAQRAALRKLRAG